MWGWILSLVVVLGITFGLIWVLIWILVWVLIWVSICIFVYYQAISISQLLWLFVFAFLLFFSSYCFLCHIYLGLNIFFLLFSSIINNTNIFISDSSLILRIPDEPPCYVRYYGGKSHLYLAIYYNMSYLSYNIYIYSYLLCYIIYILLSRGFTCIMSYVCFQFLFVYIIILYVAWYTLYYLTQPLLVFRFLNPQNSVLYDSHNYE